MSNKFNRHYDEYKAQLLALNSKLHNCSGIYIYTRTDETGISFAYIGQSISILDRCISHASGFQQHIDLSLKKHGLYSENNPYGWKLGFIEYNKDDLDAMEQVWIMKYAKGGYQLLNKTSGSQHAGKEKIAEYRPTKTYRDGIEQGRINSSREIAHLFEKHLDVSTKKNPPSKHQESALQKFNDFLNYHKKDGEVNSGGDKNVQANNETVN